MLNMHFWLHLPHAEVPGPGWNPNHSRNRSHCSDNGRSLTARAPGNTHLTAGNSQICENCWELQVTCFEDGFSNARLFGFPDTFLESLVSGKNKPSA